MRGVTKVEIGLFYNQSAEYEAFQKKEGWVTPQLLIEHLQPYISGGERMIDVGCGPGFVGEELAGIGWSGILIGADIAENRLREAKQKAIYTDCVVADAEDLPFARHSFDFVLSNTMVGLTDSLSVLEMYHLVKPGGYLACVAGESKGIPFSSERLREAQICISCLPNTKLLIKEDFGTGYTNTNYSDEHFICYILQRL